MSDVPVLAHGAGDPSASWVDLVLVLGLVALGAGYGRGVHELWARRGGGQVVSGGRAAAFAFGLVVALVAQRGPVHDAAEGSFAGHMAQHMLLMVVAAPLLAAGAAGLPLTLAAPHRLRRWVGRLRASAVVRWLRRPSQLALLAGGLHTAVLWAWHLPAPYAVAVDSAAVHAAEHLSFVGAAWLLWATVLGARPRGRPDPAGGVRRPGPAARAARGLRPAESLVLPTPVGLLVLFGTGMAAAALGAVLTLAPTPLYPPDVLASRDPLADQQLAGLVMWVPMDVVAFAVAVVLFVRWLARLDRRTPAGRDLRPADSAAEEMVR
ncbi:cytochrome c oxidase assembly protein [Phytohabitans kaempferiae]|uniref:Cytochrome c oxidase assembly protein n=1 Tax=Phytohabitans kaempferiae TaxID=1620943 RepID=A0ABV6MB22_9ACTN